VRRLLECCDRGQATGRRDFAILTVLARLGLRAAEVAGMRLEDLDWRAGELVVHGKGQRDDRLPLPGDVGDAVAEYLRRDRRQTECRAVFLRMLAPHQQLAPSAVCMIVYSACERAGVPRVGAHRLRHSAASPQRRKSDACRRRHAQRGRAGAAAADAARHGDLREGRSRAAAPTGTALAR
jgi:integrase